MVQAHIIRNLQDGRLAILMRPSGSGLNSSNPLYHVVYNTDTFFKQSRP